MLKKVSIGKGVSIVLVISMFGMGAPSLPSVYASSTDNTAQLSVQNEQLSKLEIEGTPFDQTFLPDLYQYKATVENNVQSVTLLASSEDKNAAITITANGQSVEDTSKPIPLQTGDNQIEIKVDDGGNTANTYHLTITRNFLQDLQLSSGELSPTFDASVPSYSVQVANDVNEMTVTPITADQTASILVNDTPDTDKGVPVQLSSAKTEITILVKAENGDQKTYSIVVTKASANSTGSDSSGSSTSTTSAGTGSSNVPANSTEAGSSNKPANSTGYSRPSNLSTAGFSQSSNRSAGSFSLRNTSSSQTQGAQQGASAVQQPSKATLSTLSVTKGTWNKTFSKDTYTYHIAVDNETDSVTISPAATYSGATVTIQGGTTNTISLGNQKKTIIPVVVTKDDEHKTYILVFDKDVPDAIATAAASPTVSSTDNTATDTSIKDTSVTSNTNNWTGRNNNYNNNNNGSTSFWSRLIDSIRSFFSKL
jgi:hypothetical protein